ncbi:MAG: divergent polysaccharide deacetylase family protein, partial [Deltaproteobacteria bacterium]
SLLLNFPVNAGKESLKLLMDSSFSIQGNKDLPVYFVFLRVGPRAPQEIPVSPGRQEGQRERPAPRVYSPSRGKSRPTPKLPRVAIVIDDMGIHKETGAQLLALNLDLTFSFLPYAPHTRTLARIAKRRGRDVLLHLPMEPDDAERWDPGLGALYLAMPAATLRMHFEKDLSMVPMAIGVNNHMGSKFTTDRKAMRTVLSLFRPRGLFFLDSLTTSASVGYQVARKIGVPARRRDVFLDNVQERAAVERQIDTLIRVARKNGSAVAIGHPHPATVAALTAYLQRLHTKVRVVGLHQLMR